MRGQQRCGCRWLACWRIIPARAGPTNGVGDVMWWFTDHPRSCGANTIYWENSVGVLGSSPLVRGQLRDSWKDYAAARIIPARAGPTWSVRRCRCARPDHPRSCGANSSSFFGLFVWCGSSPLVRGQQRLHERAGLFFRIIPARAGPTAPCVAAPRARADHPRSCGANGLGGEKTGRGVGSSPLVRGQRGELQNPVRLLRIIPARAGPTSKCCRLARK